MHDDTQQNKQETYQQAKHYEWNVLDNGYNHPLSIKLKGNFADFLPALYNFNVLGILQTNNIYPSAMLAEPRPPCFSCQLTLHH